MTVRGFATAPGTDVVVPALDASQRAVVQLPDGVSAAVVGAPGTGKTTTVIELIADRVLNRGWSTDELIVISPTRASATGLRDRIAARLAVPTTGPLARTANSLAYEIVASVRRRAGQSLPRLLTGGDQDGDIAQLLAGHLEDDNGPAWPEPLGPAVRRLGGFRTELRELMMRATEAGLTPEALADLGRRMARPEWVAAAAFTAEYLRVMGAARPDQFDAAELMRLACLSLSARDGGDRIERLRLVVVDDLQEATKSTVLMLRAIAELGIAIIAFGDPDVASNTFRGAEPDVLGRLGVLLGIEAIPTLHLEIAHRQHEALRSFTRAITQRIGTAGTVGHRGAQAAGVPQAAALRVIHATSPAREYAALARLLREHHLLHGVGWDAMAVVVRSGAQVPAIARALALADVPARTTVGGTPLRNDNAARALLAVIDAGIGRSPLTPQSATELLLGPFGGLDRLALRRLRLALRAEEVAGGGNRSGDDLIVEALERSGRLATIDHRIARSADRLATTLAAVHDLLDDGGTIEELLWLAWDRSGLAGAWRSQALGSGIAAAEANRNLDGVLGLFTAAKRFVEREPRAAAADFVDRVLQAEVPEDSLAPQSAAGAVLVTTPPGAIGLEFDVVAIAGMQDGSWPNLRPRGSLLYPHELVRAMSGLGDVPLDERKSVLDDELRMFALAASRARTHLILSAVVNDDEAASPFLTLVPDGTPVVSASTQSPLTLRGITGRLRRQVVTARTAAERMAAASGLAALAEAGVPGASPADWHGLLEPSTDEPAFDDEQPVPVSPSKLQAFEDSPLDWFIDSVAGTRSSVAMGLGTIVHWAMETATEASVDAIWSSVESRWRELLFEAPWLAEQQKRAARILAAGVAEYLSDFSRAGKQLVAAEGRFSLQIDRAKVNGSIDRVERAADGSVVIVDLKTGTPLVTQKKIDEHPQLGVYQLAYAAGVLHEFLDELGEHHPGGAKLLFVKKGIGNKHYREAVQAQLDEAQLEGFRVRIRQAAIGMAAAQYSGVIDLDTFGGHDVARRRLHRVGPVSGD